MIDMIKKMDSVSPESSNVSSLRLTEGSRVGVIGGGPAGSFFSYFLLKTAAFLDLHLKVDIYEMRDFNLAGQRGCNMCGGIISESFHLSRTPLVRQTTWQHRTVFFSVSINPSSWRTFSPIRW